MNARILLLACLVSCAAGVPAVPPDTVVIESAPGNVQFSHHRHEDIECVTCHHTSPGIRIKRACRSCHMAGSRMPRNSPDAFHDHCLGCHLDLKKAGRPGGPAKRCSRCHQANQQ
ncbi:MAG TPA: cytochrome c3 family protein [Gammaproteobacteria bacterium]|nr:cytochrome c3 family protein [Gammaproteobacteria bacterium]